MSSAEEQSGVLCVEGRLRQIIGRGNQAKIAAQAGISLKTLQRYLNGSPIKLENLVAIADACGVSLDWLVTGRGDGAKPRELDASDGKANSGSQNVFGSGKSRYVALPRYNIAASAGSGALAEHAQVVEYIAFDVDFVRNRLRRDPKHLVLIEARGDSMEPTIRDGDILTVDLTPDQPLAHAHLYILRVENDLLVKRLERRLDGALIVSSDNPRYNSETILRDQLDTLHILGQVLLVSAPPR